MSAIINNFLSFSHYLPFIVFFTLLLTGSCIPISEDLIIISSAIIAQEHPPLVFPLYIAIYLGVVMADNIAYWIGYLLGDKIKNRKWFKRLFSDKKMAFVQKNLNKHGIFTFIICRFIPFGVRNTLFMSSGFSRMNYKFFVFCDLIAAATSTATLFFLIYFIGVSVEKHFKIVGIILFVVIVALLITIILKFFVFQKEKTDDGEIQN